MNTGHIPCEVVLQEGARCHLQMILHPGELPWKLKNVHTGRSYFLTEDQDEQGRPVYVMVLEH